MEKSHVRIATVECNCDGTYSRLVHEAGTVGEVNLALNISEAVQGHGGNGRPICILVDALTDCIMSNMEHTVNEEGNSVPDPSVAELRVLDALVYHAQWWKKHDSIRDDPLMSEEDKDMRLELLRGDFFPLTPEPGPEPE